MTPIAFVNVIKGQVINGFKRLNLGKTQHRKLSLFPCLRNKEIDKTQSGDTLKKDDPEKGLKIPETGEETDEEIIERLKAGDVIYPYKTPMEKCYNVLLNDFKLTGRQIVYFVTGHKLGDLEHVYFPRETDILIIGGGAIGVSIAYAIKNYLPHGPEVLVIDKEEQFPHPSTNLGQGMLTQQQFTDDEEILMSQYCAEFLSTLHRNTEVMGQPKFYVPYEPLGCLNLSYSNNSIEALKRFDTMKKYNIHAKMLDNQALKERFKNLNFNDYLFGTLGLRNEGLFDPWTFLMALKCKAINLGVKFATAEVIDFGLRNKFPEQAVCRLPDGSYNGTKFAYCIFAAGMGTLKLLDIINKSDMGNLLIKLPMEERRRYEYCFYNPDGPGLDTPVVVDPDGTYFRREGLTGHYVAGVPSVPNNDSKENGVFEVLESKVQPFLMKILPNFEQYKLVNGWVDKYDTNTANEVGVIGPHPENGWLVFATGFSHLGLQYAPAIGRAVMEWVIHGSYQTIDLNRYHIENLYHKQHMEAEKRRQELIESQQRTALTE